MARHAWTASRNLLSCLPTSSINEHRQTSLVGANIAQAIKNALEWDINVPEERIQTMVEEGWVTLKGEVEWQNQKSAVDAALRDLKGVTNEIDIKLTGGEVKGRMRSK